MLNRFTAVANVPCLIASSAWLRKYACFVGGIAYSSDTRCDSQRPAKLSTRELNSSSKSTLAVSVQVAEANQGCGGVQGVPRAGSAIAALEGYPRNA